MRPTAAICSSASPPCCFTAPIARLASLRFAFRLSLSTRIDRRARSRSSHRSTASGVRSAGSERLSNLLGVFAQELTGQHG